MLLDKDDPDHMRTVRILQKLSKNAEANAIALKKWGKKDRIVSNDGLKDADEDEILDGDKTVLMTDKYPNRANHFYVNFSRSSRLVVPESATSTMKESCVSSPNRFSGQGGHSGRSSQS